MSHCPFCGHEVPVVPPVELNGEVVPGRTLFESCPRCRDMFAMAALRGISIPLDVMDAKTRWPNSSSDSNIAARCYQMADAMLKARSK